MPLKTPDFWYRSKGSSPSVIEYLMAPISLLYQYGHRINLRTTQSNSVDIPVICIGNVTVGGSGKTPVSIAINTIIKERNLFDAPFFLTRGYGGTEPGPRRIEVHEDAKTVGDEPLLLASHSNTIVSVNRYRGSQLVQELGGDCIIMDDGLQNQSLSKSVSFIVINGKMGLGNEKTIPAGPLREPIDTAILRCDAIIMIGQDERDIKDKIPEHIPMFRAEIKPSQGVQPDKGQNYIAFSGIAYPQKFFDTLEKSGYNVIESKSFSDHHAFTDHEIETLKTLANDRSAQLITTEKDYVRLPQNVQQDIKTLPVTLVWDNEEEIYQFLSDKLKEFKEP